MLKIFLDSAIGLLTLTELSILILALKSRKPLKLLLLNALLGLLALAAADLTTRFTGVHVPINWYTAAGSALFGMPAVAGFLLLPLIFV